ncbi:MAG: tRNA pseudouridine(55) synthase TruB [Lachnospiraceae bacterium]|nr:tRNA pseudouridine(55) synthase TruB [Lachnospiraceae bacterium]
MINGIINVYKERGYTSHDVVAKLRGILKQKKIGHTGTLDPEAQGVLPVCLGKATKVCELLTDKTKEYRAVLRLGVVTDTQDMTGTVLQETDVTCTEEEIRACISGFTGVQEQIPPMYSALKVDGKKLYELARQGIEVERKPRKIIIERIEIEDISLPELTMTVKCSKGTYIRTLCHDIGAALGCGGCMKSLLRIQVGPFLLENSVTIDEIIRCRDEGRLDEVVHPTDSVFLHLPELTLTPEAERFVRNGNPLYPGMPGIAAEILRGKAMESDTKLRVYSAEGEFLAVYQWDREKACYRAVKMFL